MPTRQREFLSTKLPLPSYEVAQLAYRIGGISFGLTAAADLHLDVDFALSQFAVEAMTCDVSIAVDWVDTLSIPESRLLFGSGGLWSLFAEPGGLRFSFLSPFLGTIPYKEAWFDNEFRTGRVLLCRRYFDADLAAYPMEYPLDELLMIHRLSRGQGVQVHAVGIRDEKGCGHLFLGHSGAGKSTTARLWKGHPGVHILSDDRIILRADKGRIQMYGTPWHGDAGIASPESADLSRIYFLEHANRNECVPISPGLAAAELFARSFVPHHSGEGIRFTLELLDRIAREIPCAVFRFVPDQTAVKAIRCDAA
jgi:hypothetical protein